MGLIKAFTDSALGYIGDMWADYIYCDALPGDVLVSKGRKRRSGGGDRANENVITEGSRVAVNAGQALIVVENGRVIDFTAEPGGYEYLSTTELSMFRGDLGASLDAAVERIKERVKFGGIPANDQRVYFVNTKEILDNRFGFGRVPYRDSEFNLSIYLQGFGVYSFRVTDPMAFYENVCGNVVESYNKTELNAQLKAELQNEMLPILGELSGRGLHYDRLPLESAEILKLLKERLSRKWHDERGVEIMTLTFGSILPDDESFDKIRDLQESRVYSESRAMLGARVGAASANAMESAAENPSGAVNGFVGMGMARGSAPIDVAELMRDVPSEPAPQKPESPQDSWTCVCGMVNTMSFCPNCGRKRPEPKKCPSCGFVFPPELAGMKFCPNCGTKVE